MEIIWVFYWLLVLLSLVVAVTAIVKKKYVSGGVHFVLSLVVPILNFFFVLGHRVPGTGENETAVLMRYVLRGNLIAILCVLGYIVLVFLTGYHIKKIGNNK